VSAPAATDGPADSEEGPQLGRLTKLLPLAVLAAAICLFASELMTMFELRPPGGESLCSQVAGDRHANAQMVIAGFAVVALIGAVWGASRPAAFAVAAMGVLALLIFLISDLRVANTSGSLGSACGSTQGFLFEANAVPQGGFWLELAGSLALAVTGIALAAMTPNQLAALRPGGGAKRPADDRNNADDPPHRSADPGSEPKGRLSRLSRPRTRERR
jgi:hypothetical protein